MAKFKIYINKNIALTKYKDSMLLVGFLNGSSAEYNTGSFFVENTRYIWADNNSLAEEITIPFLKEVYLDKGWIQEYPFFIGMNKIQYEKDTVSKELHNSTEYTYDNTVFPPIIISERQLTWKEYYEKNNNTIFIDVFTNIHYLHSNPFGRIYDKDETNILFFDERYTIISENEYIKLLNSQPKPLHSVTNN